MVNEELTIENDEIHNNSGEHEDGQAIPEYDLIWYDTIYSDEKEWILMMKIVTPQIREYD